MEVTQKKKNIITWKMCTFIIRVMQILCMQIFKNRQNKIANP